MPGSHFFDFASNEDCVMNISGISKAYPLDPDEYYQDGFVTSIKGKKLRQLLINCWDKGMSHLTVNGKEIPSYLIDDVTQQSYQNESCPLINCSNLLVESEEKCAGAEGHVCIVDISILGELEVGKLPWKLSNEDKTNDCVAIIFIGGMVNMLIMHL